MQNPYYRPITEETTPVQRAPPSASADNPQFNSGPKNQYGDVWMK